MSVNDFDDNSGIILTLEKEEDYLRQVNNVEKQDQDYVNGDLHLSEDISTIGL